MPVPCTVALHCELPPGATVAGLQLTATDVIVDPAVWASTVTVAVPDFVASCALVAVTVTVPAALGAVSAPLDVIVPAFALHVTAEL